MSKYYLIDVIDDEGVTLYQTGRLTEKDMLDLVNTLKDWWEMEVIIKIYVKNT